MAAMLSERCGRDAVRVAKVRHRVAAALKSDALMRGGQKSARPQRIAGVGWRIAVRENDEARQVRVFRAKAVGEPRAHARSPDTTEAGAQQQLGVGMVELIGDHAADHGQLIRDAGDVGHLFGELHPALSVLRKLIGRSHQRFLARQEAKLDALDDLGGRGLAVELVEHGLGIEEVHVGRPARHVQEDDVLARA